MRNVGNRDYVHLSGTIATIHSVLESFSRSGKTNSAWILRLTPFRIRMTNTKSLLCHDRRMSHAFHSKQPPVPLDFFTWPEHFLEIVGEFDCWPALRIVELAHQAQRIKSAVASRIAVAKIIRQQRSPSCAEVDADRKSVV